MPAWFGVSPTWHVDMAPYQGIDYSGISKRQQEFNLARIDIIRRMLAKEITKEQADAEGLEVAKRFPEFSSKPPEDDRDDPWDDLGPQWGGKRSKEDKKDNEKDDNVIPSAAKSIMRHRSACGVKLSDKDLARFWGKINVKGANECWPWKNSTRGSLGYGQFRIGDKICDAHRVALELMKGPLKKGRYILHDCDNPKCCNPRHLIPGTQQENMDVMTEKGRGNN